MIVFDSVTKTYGSKLIVQNLSFEIKPGDHVVLKGQSGAGKTTLLRLMMGLDKPDEGIIQRDMSVCMGVVFQENRLLENLTVSEHFFVVNPGITNTEVEELLEGLYIKDVKNSVPSQLSGGQKRRVCIGIALCVKPDILLLDEPFVGLDRYIKNQVIDFVKSRSKDITTVLMSHEIALDQWFENSRVLEVK